ncbi:hypothetical protein F0M18_02910 [Pseudohalioglobus sediminis]|uniref:Uncharacterized protein n=2 Tax=Pseudohalioglobus sediminis TaxID=2606449 RepID=A0A5B0X730_9GAMM|nr:hypothetical protein F0M18_02910 [Pseudohalioglobus sediminis]
MMASQGTSTGKTRSGLLTALTCALAVAASGLVYLESFSDSAWECAPMVPEGSASSAPPCFRASVFNANSIRLEWRVGTPGASVYLYSDTDPSYRDPGAQPARCPDEPDSTCSTTVTVEQGGTYRWVLAVIGDNASFHAGTEVNVAPPAVPQVTAGGGFVDLLRPQGQVLTWTAPDSDSAAIGSPTGFWVEVRPHATVGWLPERYPPAGVGAEYAIGAGTFQAEQEYVYSLRSCHLPAGSTGKFCSPPVSVGFRAGYDSFTSYRNLTVPPGEPLEISFTNQSGDARMLSSATLLPQEVMPVEGTAFTIEGTRLTVGDHHISLDSCLLPQGPCSNRRNAVPAEKSGAFWRRREGNYREGEEIGRLFPADKSPMISVLAPATGEVHYLQSGPVSEVAAGDLLAYSITQPGDLMTISVGAPMDWVLARPYTDDFYPATALASRSKGQALDIAFDTEGAAWLLKEYSNSLERVSVLGEVEILGLPMPRHTAGASMADQPPGSAFPPSKPFTFNWGAMWWGRSSITSLAEKITLIDNKIWLTQGGSLLSDPLRQLPNLSRVIAFNPETAGSPTTPYDDRFCVYTMPADDVDGRGDNQVIGVTGLMGRIWVAESRGLLSEDQAYLSSFVPDPRLCDNLLTVEDANAMQSQPMQYCADGHSPEQDGCVEKLPLPSHERPIKIAHLEADPDAGLIWFTDASGQFLGSYDATGESGFILRRFSEDHLDAYDSIGKLGGFPWDLQVTTDAVYVGEYASRHILRFDKSSGEFSEISVPYLGRHSKLHSLALDRLRDRLWFTLAYECAVPGKHARSTIGYVDLASWRRLLETDSSSGNISGVIYDGLETAPACEMHPGRHQNFRGIAIDPNSGRIAIATGLREQVTLLEPRAGFWP